MIINSFKYKWQLMQCYYPIMDNKLQTITFLWLPFRMSHLFPICRFKLGSIGFNARRCDLVGVQEIALSGEYDWIHHLASETDTIILDLGANIGLFSILAFKYFPDAEVHSFEPSTDTFQILEMNRQLNDNLNWNVYNKAIWNDDCSIKFGTGGASTERRISSGSGDCEYVAATTLINIIDNILILKKKISICKIDIEGAEEVVLQSSIDKLDFIENLIVEIHPYLCDANNVMDILKSKYSHLYEIGGRISKKPLILASRKLFSRDTQSHISLIDHQTLIKG